MAQWLDGRRTCLTRPRMQPCRDSLLRAGDREKQDSGGNAEADLIPSLCAEPAFVPATAADGGADAIDVEHRQIIAAPSCPDCGDSGEIWLIEAYCGAFKIECSCNQEDETAHSTGRWEILLAGAIIILLVIFLLMR